MLNFFYFDKKSKRTFVILLFLSCLYILPIIIADSYYFDDWYRSISGYAGWEYLGRPLSTWILNILCFGSPLFDISPLPLILSIIILCYSLVLFARQYFINYPSNNVAYALFFFIGNPFLLENLSYKYDVLSMFIAISSMIILFSFSIDIGKIKFLFLNILCITITLNTYQPALCAFFCFIVIKLLFDILNDKNIDIKYIYIYVLSLIISYILYKITTIKYFISGENKRAYAALHSSFIDFDYLNIFYCNLKQFMKNISILLNSIPNFYIVISFLLISIFTLFVIHTYNKKYYYVSILNKIPILVLISFSPIIILINTYLLMAALKSPVFFFRTMISFSCFVMIIGISILIISKYIKFVSLLFIPFLLFMFSISYIYGNILKNQKKYIEHILQNLSYDLERDDLIHTTRKISFLGKPYDTIQVYIAGNRFPIIKYLIPSMLDSNLLAQWGGKVTLSHYIQKNLNISSVDDGDREYILRNNPYIKNILYDLYINNDKIIVNFSKYKTLYEKKVSSFGDSNKLIIKNDCLGKIGNTTKFDDLIEVSGWILHSTERSVDNVIALSAVNNVKKYITIEQESRIEFAHTSHSEILSDVGFRVTLPAGEYLIGYQLDNVFYQCNNLKID